MLELREKEILSADLFGLDCKGITDTEDNEIEAYFLDDEKTVTNVIRFLESEALSYKSVYMENRDWTEEWRKNFKPVRLTDKIMVYPPWMEPVHDNLIPLFIEPKMAFGTGHHESTRLCAKLLEKHCPGMNSMVDIGTGTGILAISAAKLGLPSITALEIDPVTLDSARESLDKNECSQVTHFIGTLTALRSPLSFDLATVNIISSITYSLLPELAPRIGKKVIFSGTLKSEKDIFIGHVNKSQSY